MIYRSTVLARPGWTEGALKKFAGEPDKLVPNPHYKSGPQSALYLLSRIEQIESTFIFGYWREQADKRKALAKKSSAKAVETKRTKMLEWAQTIPLKIERRELATVTKLAEAHHAWQAYERGRAEVDYDHVSKDFTDRITVNYLRHQQSRYEDLLRATYGRVGTEEAYAIIKRRVLAAIAEAYPELKQECDRQAATI